MKHSLRALMLLLAALAIPAEATIWHVEATGRMPRAYGDEGPPYPADIILRGDFIEQHGHLLAFRFTATRFTGGSISRSSLDPCIAEGFCRVETTSFTPSNLLVQFLGGSPSSSFAYSFEFASPLDAQAGPIALVPGAGAYGGGGFTGSLGFVTASVILLSGEVSVAQTTTVPEPQSYVILACGLLLVVSYVVRRGAGRILSH